jgi:hypothetical protein
MMMMATTKIEEAFTLGQAMFETLSTYQIM